MCNLCLGELNRVKFVVISRVRMHLECLTHVILFDFIILVTYEGPLACCDREFESHLGHVCLLRVLCVVRYRSQRLTDHPFRGVLLTVAYHCV
jgi:hypothetical protein